MNNKSQKPKLKSLSFYQNQAAAIIYNRTIKQVAEEVWQQRKAISGRAS